MRSFSFLLLLNLGVTDFGNLCVITLTFSLISLKLELLHVDFILLDAIYKFLLRLPFSLEILLDITQVGKLLRYPLSLRYRLHA